MVPLILHMPQIWWKKLSDLGEPTLLIVGALALFMHLWRHDDRRAVAWHWAMAFGLCISLTIASKVFGYAVGGGGRTPLIHSPSGHVAIATTFYGACAMYLMRGHGSLVRISVAAGTAIFVGMLAGSRVALNTHSLAEIGVAFAIGMFCLGVFGRQLNRSPRSTDRRQFMAMLLLLAAARFARIDGEAIIAYGASRMADIYSLQAGPLVVEAFRLEK